MHEEELYSSLQWDNPTSEASQKCLCPSKCSEHSIMPDMFTGMDELVKMKKKKGTGLWKYDIYSLSNLKKGTWCVMTVISCVFCVGLLATSIFLGIKFFQVSSLAMNQQERLIQQDRALLNLTEWQRNYTLQMKSCQALLQRSPRSGSNCIPCPHNWIQNGKSCYYAFHIWQIWNGSEKNCLKEDASLLQINSKEEMDFIIRSQWMRTGAEYWVGVFQDRFSQSWFWQDGSSLFSDLLPTARELSASQICGYFKDHSFFSDNCSSWKYFICEKNAFRSCI